MDSQPLDRYARHRAIEGFSQEDLQASRVAVIGAGAIGNEVVKNLCLLGVGHIDLYDFDTVELHNLTRSVLLREEDIGRSKARSVARRASSLDPAVVISPVDGDLWQTLRFDALKQYRCVVGALDNFEARLRLNQLCWIAGVDWINAAIDSRYVSVEAFPFATARAAGGNESPACYECGLPASVYQRIAERYSCGGLQRAAAAQRIMPTTAITASFAGAQAVNRALRMAGSAQRWLLDTHSGLANQSALLRAPGCPCCDALPPAARITRPVAGEGAAEAVDAAARRQDVDTVRLSDSLIWTCECANCGRTDATRAVELQRAAAVSDSITYCLQCHSPAIRVEIRDEFDAGELSGRFAAEATLPARFAIVGDNCIDLQPRRHSVGDTTHTTEQ